MKKRDYSCYAKCGLTASGPSALGVHYKTHASHRPPNWAARHDAPSQKKHKSAKVSIHSHLSVVKDKSSAGSWAKRMSVSQSKLEALTEQLEMDLAAAMMEAAQAQQTVDYISKLRNQLVDALGKAA